MDWAKTAAKRDEKQVLEFGATYTRGFSVIPYVMWSIWRDVSRSQAETLENVVKSAFVVGWIPVICTKWPAMSKIHSTVEPCA